MDLDIKRLEYDIYEGMCHPAEVSERTRNKIVSRWEETTGVFLTEFTRTTEIKHVRSPQAIDDVVHHLLTVVLFHGCSGDMLSDLFNNNWDSKFRFLTNRLSAVKKELIVSQSKNVKVIKKIVRFYLLCLLKPVNGPEGLGDKHRAYSEAYSTLCHLFTLIKVQKMFSNDDLEFWTYYFFMNLKDINTLNLCVDVFQSHPSTFKLCLNVYKTLNDGNYHRLYKLFIRDLTTLQRASLCKEIGGMRSRMFSTIISGYKHPTASYSLLKVRQHGLFLEEELIGVLDSFEMKHDTIRLILKGQNTVVDGAFIDINIDFETEDLSVLL